MDETINEILYIKNLNDRIKLPTLKDTLMKIFRQFGQIIDIKVKDNMQMKGQAFITFTNSDNAKKAKEVLNGKILYNKDMKIFYAKQKSDALLKEQGSFDQAIYEKRKEENKLKKDAFFENLQQKLLSKKRFLNNNVKNPDISHKLIIDNITNLVDYDDIYPLFSKINGFRSLNIVKELNVCFIDYETEIQAKQALLANNKYEIKGVRLNIKFAKI